MADFVEEIGHVFCGSPARTRTTDKVVNSHLLYRLSYWGICSYKLLTLQAVRTVLVAALLPGSVTIKHVPKSIGLIPRDFLACQS